LESCKRKMQPLLLNTPFSTHLITNGQVFFHKNKKSDAIGKSKKCFLMLPERRGLFSTLLSLHPCIPNAIKQNKNEYLR